MEFSITSDVYAPADLMFAVLTDVERWPEWTSTVTRVERLDTSSRPFGVGSRIRIVQPKVRSDFHQTPVLERPGGRHAAVHDVR